MIRSIGGARARARVAAGLALGLLLAGCGAEEEGEPQVAAEPPVTFETGQVCLVSGADTTVVPVELAQTPAQRAHGLMERDALPSGAGMLFTFQEEQAPEQGFWMFRTRIPLDIAYLGADGEVVSIQQMAPCTSPDPRWCESYPSGAPYYGALEVNQGFLASRGIGVGDRVLRAGEPGCPG